MELKNQLEEIKSDIVSRIELATQKRYSETIISNSKLLEDCERLLRKYEELKTEVTWIQKGMKNNLIHVPHRVMSELTVEKPVRTHRTRREALRRANEERQKLIHDLSQQGIYLRKEGRSDRLYKSPDGKLYGIGFASEALEGKWWFGLQLREYHCIVLICEHRLGKIKRFLIPKDFVEKYQQSFSSSGNEYKLSIFKSDERYELGLIDIGRVDVNTYLDNYSAAH